jgi:hypothetical protein
VALYVMNFLEGFVGFMENATSLPRSLNQIRRDELAKSLEYVLLSIAIPGIPIFCILDFAFYGFRWDLLLVQCLSLPGLFWVVWKCRTQPLAVRQINFVAMIIGFYGAAMNTYLAYAKSDLTLNSWELMFEFLFPMVLIPMSRMSFGILAIVTATCAVLANHYFLGYQNNKIGIYQNLRIFMESCLLMFVFSCIHQLRERIYLKTFDLERELASRELVIEEQSKQLAQTKVQAAIGQATQMLAHDIRKPFSLMKAAWHALESAGSDA